jgi:hypothetical protein
MDEVSNKYLNEDTSLHCMKDDEEILSSEEAELLRKSRMDDKQISGKDLRKKLGL